MPTVLRVGPYRFFFYSYDLGERMHIHVICGQNEAKFWLDDVTLAKNLGMAENDLRTVQKLVVEHRELLIHEWNRRKTER
ncbi:MAG: DUF4160 domain-containing protein [Victivallales bacterium]|nr:DUF4160 domain-containing protein [Victivallales bacterium]MBR5025241.1 DUF4160 domain-containing protein [Victivallales bacterium]